MPERQAQPAPQAKRMHWNLARINPLRAERVHERSTIKPLRSCATQEHRSASNFFREFKDERFRILRNCECLNLLGPVRKIALTISGKDSAARSCASEASLRFRAEGAGLLKTTIKGAGRPRREAPTFRPVIRAHSNRDRQRAFLRKKGVDRWLDGPYFFAQSAGREEAEAISPWLKKRDQGLWSSVVFFGRPKRCIYNI